MVKLIRNQQTVNGANFMSMIMNTNSDLSLLRMFKHMG